MNLYERQIQDYKLKIKSLEETPDSILLKGNKLFYELGIEKLEVELDAWKRGKPTCQGSGDSVRLLNSLGLAHVGNLIFALNAVSDSYRDYKPIIEGLGFPEKCCERSVSQLAVCEIGDLPKADLVFTDGHGCDAEHKYSSQCLGNWFGAPMFYVDVPVVEDDKPSLDCINYVAAQLGEFIEWAEKQVPGIKYDEAKHIECLEMDAIGEKYKREMYELITHYPCPVAPEDTLRHRIWAFQPSRFPNMQKGTEFLRMCRDEMGERVANGQGPYEERLRLLWGGQGNVLGAVDPRRLFMERKVALPLLWEGSTSKLGRESTHYGELFEGIKLSPLQEEAKDFEESGWGGPGKRSLNGIVAAARHIGAQGILHYLTIGCTPHRSMGSAIAERAEKELGIPTLNLEGRQVDPDYMTREEFEEIVSRFIDKCFDWAGKPRQ